MIRWIRALSVNAPQLCAHTGVKTFIYEWRWQHGMFSSWGNPTLAMRECVQRGGGEVPETASSGLSHSGRKPGLHHPAEVISDYNWTGIRQLDRLARTCPVPAIHSLFRGLQAVPFLLWTFVWFRNVLIDWGVCLFHSAYQCEAVADH